MLASCILDGGADGFFVGEGCGALVLRRLADCDTVHALPRLAGLALPGSKSNETGKVYASIDSVAVNFSLCRAVAAVEATPGGITVDDVDYWSSLLW